jgi:hypothetical protein
MRAQPPTAGQSAAAGLEVRLPRGTATLAADEQVARWGFVDVDAALAGGTQDV